MEKKRKEKGVVVVGGGGVVGGNLNFDICWGEKEKNPTVRTGNEL